MANTFADIVEGIKPLSIQEKSELLDLIKKYLIEERRQEILDSAVESIAELNEGKLEFSEDLDELKRTLSNV
jgi:hypothetical protein